MDGGEPREEGEPPSAPDEALSTGAEVVSTACPYCYIMIDDTVKARRRKTGRGRCSELSQVVEASLGSVAATPAQADSSEG